MKTQKFPVRLHGFGALEIIILPKNLGGSAKLFLRDVARNQFPRLYHQRIEVGICGQTNSGQKIPINSVGRWLFGTPGYMGHLRTRNFEGCECIVEFPKNSPDVVYELIALIKKSIKGLEKNK